METNPIEGRIKFFDTPSLLMVLIFYLVYIPASLVLIPMQMIGQSPRYLSGLIGRSMSLLFGRLTILAHRKIKYSRVCELESLPKQYVLIANHLSQMDLLYMATAFAKPTYLGKIEVKRSIWGLPGIIHDNIFVKREDRNSRMAALYALRDRAAKGYSLGIFPEGQSNKVHGDLLDFNLGAFLVAKEFGLPIVISAIHDYPLENGKREITHEIFHILDSKDFDNAASLGAEAHKLLKARLERKRREYQNQVLDEDHSYAETGNMVGI